MVPGRFARECDRVWLQHGLSRGLSPKLHVISRRSGCRIVDRGGRRKLHVCSGFKKWLQDFPQSGGRRHTLLRQGPINRKRRIKQLYAANVACRLKSLVEDKGHRWDSLKKFTMSFLKFLRPPSQRSQNDVAVPKVLSKREQFCAYLKGLSLFYQAQRGTQNKNPQHNKPLPKASGMM